MTSPLRLTNRGNRVVAFIAAGSLRGQLLGDALTTESESKLTADLSEGVAASQTAHESGESEQELVPVQ